MRRWLTRVLRLPPPPEPPVGSSEATRIFNAAPGYLRYRIFTWSLGQLGTLAGILVGLATVSLMPERLEFFIGGLLRFAELLALALFGGQLILSFLLLKLDYQMRWYIVTDRTLRIREGVFKVREQTVSFANVQNVSVTQGPLQRLFGIADLEIRTAGGGGGSETDGQTKKHDLHRAVFRGVDDAESIRDRILRDLRRLRDAGLGDGSEAEPAVDRELEAARALTAEARALRHALTA